MSKISVIVPIYNAEKYLAQCLDSIIKQTIEDIEIILINDGSCDGSAEICKAFIEKDRRVTYYYKENEGLAAARQDGMERSSGEYIGFVDSDDWIEPDMYEKMYTAAKTCDADVVLCNPFTYSEKSSIKGNIPSGAYDYQAIRDAVLPKSVITIDEKGQRRNLRWSNCIRIYKRENIEKNHLAFTRSFRRCQDYPFTLDNMLCAKSFYYLDEYLYHNRQDSGSLSRGYTKDMWSLIKPLILHVNDSLKERPDIDWKAANEASAFFLSWDCIANEFKPDAPGRREKIKHIQEIISDPVCQNGLRSMEGTRLNRYYYRVFYQNMAKKNALKLVLDYYYYHSKLKSRVIAPLTNKLSEIKLIKKIRGR